MNPMTVITIATVLGCVAAVAMAATVVTAHRDSAYAEHMRKEWNASHPDCQLLAPDQAVKAIKV